MIRRPTTLFCSSILAFSFLWFAAPAQADLIGHWLLNEGSGDTTADRSASGTTGEIANHTTGGLGPNGSVWVNDPERGTVISFDGMASGSYVRVGDIPQMTLAQDFSWVFWGNQDVANTSPNDIIFGNRRNESNQDFSPRQFIKFTPTKFEFHMNGNGNDDLNYEDIPAGEWIHHVVVKDGTALTYYRNGEEAGTDTITQALDFPQPLFLGGDNTGRGGENWRGMLSDVRIYDNALAATAVREIFLGLDAGVPGDVNGDEVVNNDDFDIILANFFQSVIAREDGDLNLDGFVDFKDFHQWKANRTGGTAAAAAVPEPTGLLLCLPLLIALCGLRRRRR